MESSPLTGLARTALASVHSYEVAISERPERRFDPANRADSRPAPRPAPDLASLTPPDRIDGLVKSAAGTLTVAHNLDVLADATEPEPHTLDVLA